MVLERKTMSQGIKIILVGVEGSGKSVLAEELKNVLIRYGVKSVVSVQHDSFVQISKHAFPEWETK